MWLFSPSFVLVARECALDALEPNSVLAAEGQLPLGNGWEELNGCPRL
jgi:hypothetical protein